MSSTKDDAPETWLPAWLFEPEDATDEQVCVGLPRLLPLTAYEVAAVLAKRSLELAQGAQPNVPVDADDLGSLELAKRELATGCMPAMGVVRYPPTGPLVRVSVKAGYRAPHFE